VNRIAKPAHLTYFTATLDQPTKLVREYRANESAIRQLRRNLAGARNVSTEKALQRRLDDRYLAEASVLVFGTEMGKYLVGALVEERNLLDRLAVDPNRPELKSSLHHARDRIRISTVGR
jgi:hypothetical protein